MKRIITYATLVFVGIFCGILINTLADRKEVTFSSYEGQISEVPITNYDGAKEKILSDNRPAIVIYHKNGCGACLDELPQVQYMAEILAPVVDVKIIWQGGIDKKTVEELQISKNLNYSVDTQEVVNSESPYFFGFDRDGRECLRGANLKDIVRCVYDTLTENEKSTLKNNAIHYLTDKYFTSSGDAADILYFSMEGCKDCAAVENIVDELDKEYNLAVLYSSGSNTQLDKDYYSVMATVFEIDWYPSFLVIKNEKYGKVGKIEPTDLKNEIDNIADTL